MNKQKLIAILLAFSMCITFTAQASSQKTGRWKNSLCKKGTMTTRKKGLCTTSSLATMIQESHTGGEKVTTKRIRVATEGLANPERGFRFEIKVGQEDGPTENRWPFDDYRDDGIVMTQAYCYLTDY